MPAAKLFSQASEPHGGDAIARRSGTLRGRCRLVRTTAAVQWSGGGEPPCQLVPRLCRATAPTDRARLRPHAIRVGTTSKRWHHGA